MAEPVLYHRAPAFAEVLADVLEKLPPRLPDRKRRARLPGLGLGRDGVGGRQPRAPRPPRAGLRRRQVRRALDRAVRGLRRRPRALRAGLGRAARPGGDRGAARRRRGRVRHAERDVDRHRARRPGDRRGRPRRGRHARRRRGVRPRGRRAAPGRVGRRRRRRRLAEGAHVPARPGLRVRLPARAGRRRRPAPGRPLLLRLGQDRRRHSARTRRTPPSLPRSRSSAGSTSRWT